MTNFLQHLPEKIDPIALQVGFFSLSWYSLMYLIGFLVVYALLTYRIKNRETKYSSEMILDLLTYSFLGLLLGGRLGYALFYNASYFWQNPLALISPWDTEIGYVGIYGMSFYGGLAGVILASSIFCWKKKVAFLKMADFVVPAVPAGYFFGRLGNFLNGELFGRITTAPWGMYFFDGLPGPKVLRHPSQLYEAFFEGLIIFVILWIWRKRSSFPGQLFLSYLLLYGFFRFFIEFFRQPDPQSGLFLGFLTLWQVLSSCMFFVAGGFFWYNYRKIRE